MCQGEVIWWSWEASLILFLDHKEFPLTVKLSGCVSAPVSPHPPNQWNSNFVLRVYADTVMEFWGTMMMQIINNNKLFMRVSTGAKAA